jgi:hypothetical protein
MVRKYVVTLEDTLKGWQEDEDELERKYGAEPLDCGNCEIVQASINTGIRTATRLVEDVLGKIKEEIEQIEINGYIRDIECFTAGINTALNVIDKYRKEQTDAT